MSIDQGNNFGAKQEAIGNGVNQERQPLPDLTEGRSTIPLLPLKLLLDGNDRVNHTHNGIPRWLIIFNDRELTFNGQTKLRIPRRIVGEALGALVAVRDLAPSATYLDYAIIGSNEGLGEDARKQKFRYTVANVIGRITDVQENSIVTSCGQRSSARFGIYDAGVIDLRHSDMSTDMLPSELQEIVANPGLLPAQNKLTAPRAPNRTKIATEPKPTANNLSQSRKPGATSDISDWQGHKLCTPDDLELFFGRPGESKRTKENREAAAKAICGDCAVVVKCLDYALAHRVSDGIWGGRTEKERRQILRANRR